MWSTPSKSIELSAFTQRTGTEIPLDHDDIDRVKKAINMGILMRISADKEYPKFGSKDLSYGRVEDNMKVRETFNVAEYLDMLQEEVIVKVKDIEEPKLLITLIQAEKKGQNKEKVPRQNVISALRNRIKTINVNGMYDIEIDDL